MEFCRSIRQLIRLSLAVGLLVACLAPGLTIREPHPFFSQAKPMRTILEGLREVPSCRLEI